MGTMLDELESFAKVVKARNEAVDVFQQNVCRTRELKNVKVVTAHHDKALSLHEVASNLKNQMTRQSASLNQFRTEQASKETQVANLNQKIAELKTQLAKQQTDAKRDYDGPIAQAE